MIVQLGAPRGELRLPGGELAAGGADLIRRVGKLLLGLVQLRPAVIDLLLALSDLALGVGKLLFAVLDLLLAVRNRLRRVVKLHLRIRQLVLRVLQFLLAVRDLLLGVGDLVRALLLHLVIARPAARVLKQLDAVLDPAHIVLVVLIVADHAVRAVGRGVDDGVGFQRKALRRHHQEEAHVAVADVRRAAVKVQIPGIGAGAHDGEGIGHQRIAMSLLSSSSCSVMVSPSFSPALWA